MPGAQAPVTSTLDREVAGSNPARPTNRAVAQWQTHVCAVADSDPRAPTSESLPSRRTPTNPRNGGQLPCLSSTSGHATVATAVRHRQAARPRAPPTRVRRASRATPRASCSCSPWPTWSARTRSTRRRGDRDDRYDRLIAEVAVADPQWMARFLAWLRAGANMRSASLVGALEAARGHARRRHVPAPGSWSRRVLQRADEPGEALAYWTAALRPRVPKPVKRGIADAVAAAVHRVRPAQVRHRGQGFRFGDVLDLTHPAPAGPGAGRPVPVALDRRHERDSASADVAADARRQRGAAGRRGRRPARAARPDGLRAAGMTWEDVLSLAGSGCRQGRAVDGAHPVDGLHGAAA